MKLREKLLEMIQWTLGDGKTCMVYGDPWGQASRQSSGQGGTSATDKVSTLINSDIGLWDVEKLIEKFGHVECLRIVSSVPPPTDEAGPDLLVFNLSSNGEFAVKQAYAKLTQREQHRDLMQEKF